MSAKTFGSKTLSAKNKWRSEIKESLQKLSEDQIQQKSNLIVQQLQIFLKRNPGKWACFRGLLLEPNLETLWNEHSILKDIEWFFPRMNGKTLSFHSACGWEKGSFEVWEPLASCAAIEARELQGFLVPGVGFNVRGERLGHGKGFYDRALADCSGIKLGVGFQRQVIDGSFGFEEWDVPMDLICTEDGLINCELK